MTDELLLTIDGHSMAFRAFYALPTEMVARDGTSTNAVYGFASMLSTVIARYNPTHLMVAFDTAAPTFRSEKDDQYKAQRDETPELFIPQVDLIIELLEAMNVEVCMQDGMEADDLIATFATTARDKKIPSIHVTGDRDYFQLVEDPMIQVLYVRRGVSDTVLYDEAGIIERTGIRPDQYVDYAAMRGDPSDNLPGIAGVGEKTAAKLLIAYEHLEGIYENIEELKGKQKEKVIDGRDRAFLNRELMTLVRDVKGLPDLDALLRKPGNAEEIKEICEKLQFRTLANKILSVSKISGSSKPADSKKPQKIKAETISEEISEQIAVGASIAIEEAKLSNLDLEQFEKLFIKPEGVVGIYLEPKSPNAHVDESIRFPLSILVSHSNLLGELVVKNKTELKKALKALSRNPHLVVGYDIKSWGSYFELCSLKQVDANDLYVMAALDDSGRGKKTIEQMSSSYLGIAPVEPPGQLGLDGMSDNVNQNVDLEKIAKVLYLLELHDEILNRIKTKELERLYLQIERPLTPVIGEIETHGVLVDKQKLKTISKDIHERCLKFEHEIHSYAGEPINVNSTKQLRVVLFDQLGLTPIKKTKTGPSTDAATLHALIDEHPIIPAILNYREVEKLRSTYIDALDPLIAADGRIHATFNQTLTSTGRISSEAPNLQNIPIRSEEGKNLRKMFVAPEGSLLCAIDYSQIELRILAHLSGEKTLLEAFNRGEDVHGTTAAKVFEVDQKDVTPEQRSFAKVVNFGIAYGMESYGLATRMGIDPGHAKEILDSYWASFPDMKQYLDDVVEEAKEVGYTETMFGRRRYFPELSSSIARVRIAGARAATNAPVQGSAADIFKLAMVEVSKYIKENELPASTVLTVHDELVFEIKESQAEDISSQIAKVMENVVELDVPLVADIGIGSNWAEAK